MAFVKEEVTTDILPATYHYHDANGKHAVGDPAEDTAEFLRMELCLGSLVGMLRHLWFAGAKRPAMPLHYHLALGRELAVVERMDLHLLWTYDGKLFVKPVPHFLLDPAFCKMNLRCLSICSCDDSTDVCQRTSRKIALGFLYTYACLISSESDFNIAKDKHLLPCNGEDVSIKWADWKILTRELLRIYARDSSMIHPRFQHAELRLSRVNIIHRLTSFPRFDPYLRNRYDYGSFFGDNLAWMTVAIVFVALVLNAMQVGLATERLKDDAVFQQASYGFAVFAILGPMCALASVVLGALFHLVKDLPLLLARQRDRASAEPHYFMSNNSQGMAAQNRYLATVPSSSSSISSRPATA